MATPTYTPIASITLGSSASSVTFSSIPQDYRDLVFVINGSLTPGSSAVVMYLNSDTGSNYSRVSMLGNGSSATSSSASNAVVAVFAAAESMGIVQLMDYSATDKHKTALSRSNTTSRAEAFAYRWANTSAVTSAEFSMTNPEDFASGTTFALFGIEA